MANPSTTAHGNVIGEWVLAITISPTSVAPNNTAEQTFTVNGLQLGDFVEVNKPSLNQGLAIVNSRVSAANTLAIQFGNLTAATITPTASEVYFMTVTRPENLTTYTLTGSTSGPGANLTQLT
jgi:hypothetical protein